MGQRETEWIRAHGFKSVLDIGANSGQFAEMFLDILPDAEYYCFEPLSEPFSELQNKFGSLPNFHLYNVALGDKNEERQMFRNEFSPSSSMLPMADTHKDAFDFARKEFEERVGVQRLDDLPDLLNIETPYIVKLDVQGYELSVIHGGENVVRSADMIILETSFVRLYENAPLFDDIHETLKGLGFVYTGSFGTQVIRPLDGLILQQDSIFMQEAVMGKFVENGGSLMGGTAAEQEVVRSEEMLANSIISTEIVSDAGDADFEKVTDEARLNETALAGQTTQSLQAERELNAIIGERDAALADLKGIHSTPEWRTGLLVQKMVKMVIPRGSGRRKIAVMLVRVVKTLNKVIVNMGRSVMSVLFLSRVYLFGTHSREPRTINKQSKKIVYIGHSYHDKTKSTVFLIDYLKEFYDVEVVLDESWNGKPYPDLSFIDESYLGVIFFQNLPKKRILKSIKNKNIIFFPMYDGVRHDFAFWRGQYDLKIINFSKTLNNRLAKCGFDSMFVQYFPDERDFLPGATNEVFFWQRLTRLNIGVVDRLFGGADARIHLHKTIDPGQKFQQLSEQQEKKYRITYSDWFETREEMQDVIKEKGIYIAPREFEGIGMSFLEAMSMGKAVVAVNNPTMNEYITHGENGYLFDLKKPKVIDFSNIETVQKNAHAFMKEGRARWERDKRRIIDFIEKE